MVVPVPGSMVWFGFEQLRFLIFMENTNHAISF